MITVFDAVVDGSDGEVLRIPVCQLTARVRSQGLRHLEKSSAVGAQRRFQ
jgi:uncharacterized C2H2 Zn-finger protein